MTTEGGRIMKKRLYRITAAALMMTMLAASIVGCSKSSSGEAGSSAETSTADSGKQAAERQNRIKSLNSPGRSSAEG